MKGKKDSNINPSGSANPPDTERDLFTGRYKVDKKTALKQWFQAAKERSNRDGVRDRNIDPKQAIYNPVKSKRRKR